MSNKVKSTGKADGFYRRFEAKCTRSKATDTRKRAIHGREAKDAHDPPIRGLTKVSGAPAIVAIAEAMLAREALPAAEDRGTPPLLSSKLDELPDKLPNKSVLVGAALATSSCEAPDDEEPPEEEDEEVVVRTLLLPTAASALIVPLPVAPSRRRLLALLLQAPCSPPALALLLVVAGTRLVERWGW